MPLISVMAVALLLTIAPVHALEHCTRALLGDGPALAPMVCTEVVSERGETVAVREFSDVRSPHAGGPHDYWAWRARWAYHRATAPRGPFRSHRVRHHHHR